MNTRQSLWCLLVVLTVGLVACGEDAPAPRAATPGWMAKGAPLPPEDDPEPTRKQREEPVATLTSAQDLKAALPRLKRSGDLSWGEMSTMIPGHLGARLMDPGDGKDGAPRHVMTILIDDLLERPYRRDALKAQPELFSGKYPGDIARDLWIRVLVKERYEILIRAEDPAWRKHEKLKSWFDRMRLGELER